MKRSKTLVAVAVVAVTVALTAPAGAVPGPVAQQETPTEGTPMNETPTDGMANETTPEEETPDDEPTAPTDNETEETPSLTFDDQETDGQTVTVSDVTLTEPGYVVIHDDRLASDQVVDSVIGTSDYLPAGEYDNVTITLFDVPGAEYEDAQAENVTDGEMDTAAQTPTETPGEANMTETPGEANMTETPGEANMTETSDNETQLRLSTDQELTAMLHVESSENEMFDFVETVGLLDGPVTVDDVPVTDTANVTVTDDTTDNATTNETETATEPGAGEETATEPGAGEATEAATP